MCGHVKLCRIICEMLSAVLRGILQPKRWRCEETIVHSFCDVWLDASTASNILLDLLGVENAERISDKPVMKLPNDSMMPSKLPTCSMLALGLFVIRLRGATVSCK